MCRPHMCRSHMCRTHETASPHTKESAFVFHNFYAYWLSVSLFGVSVDRQTDRWPEVDFDIASRTVYGLKDKTCDDGHGSGELCPIR